MGRPENCNTCCDQDDVLPPISECKKLICIAIIDENFNSTGRDTVDAKFAEWQKAFPERILFVVDVFRRDPNNPDGTPKLYFPDGWNNYNNAFNLRGEFQRGVSVPEFCNRDNGDVGLATDIWAALTTIATDRGVTTEFNDATQVSIFVDVSKSMPKGTVDAAYDLLKSKVETAGKKVVSSTFNENEDYICPFVTGGCCLNSSVDDIQSLCSVSPDCSPQNIYVFSTTDHHFGVRLLNFNHVLARVYFKPSTSEYITDDRTWLTFFGGIRSPFGLTNYDKNIQSSKRSFYAVVNSATGQNLDYIELSWKLQFTDDELTQFGTQNSTDIDYDITNSFSGEENLREIIFSYDDWGGSSLVTSNSAIVHDLLSLGDGNYSYDTTYSQRGSTSIRVYRRKFRFVATAVDYPSLVGYGQQFSLADAYAQSTSPPLDPPAGDGSSYEVSISFDMPKYDSSTSTYTKYINERKEFTVRNSSNVVQTSVDMLEDLEGGNPYISMANYLPAKSLEFQVQAYESISKINQLFPMATDARTSTAGPGLNAEVKFNALQNNGLRYGDVFDVTSLVQIPVYIPDLDLTVYTKSFPLMFNRTISASSAVNGVSIHYGDIETSSRSIFGGWSRFFDPSRGLPNYFHSSEQGRWASSAESRFASSYYGKFPATQEQTSRFPTSASANPFGQGVDLSEHKNVLTFQQAQDADIFTPETMTDLLSRGIGKTTQCEIGPYFEIEQEARYLAEDCTYFRSLLDIRITQNFGGRFNVYGVEEIQLRLYKSRCRFAVKFQLHSDPKPFGANLHQVSYAGWFYPRIMLVPENSPQLALCSTAMA